VKTTHASTSIITGRGYNHLHAPTPGVLLRKQPQYERKPPQRPLARSMLYCRRGICPSVVLLPCPKS